MLDDARSGSDGARLFANPREIVRADRPDEVAPALARLRAAQAEGLHAAGFMAFEAGHALEPRLAPLARPGKLLWFGLFDAPRHIPADRVLAELPDPAAAWAGTPKPMIDPLAYAAAFDRVQDYIAAGDIYQANLTYRAEVPCFGAPLALYARLRRYALSGWGGVLFDGEDWLLSLSPELFFTLEDGHVTVRPMKGTAARLPDPAADARAAEQLASDSKQRAENLMIVDLLRNDLSRLATPGSVRVTRAFAVETYPTVHQMTSTVEARLTDGRDAVDLLAAIFPCGSVTGAPKIRAIEIIEEVETLARGPYTGSIGWLGPQGSAGFNVAIRTLSITKGRKSAILGLGSGIVADSQREAEWRECMAKGEFVTMASRPFDLIETMHFDAIEGFVDLDRHMARMKASADALGFAFNRHDCRNDLQAATFRLADSAKIRLLLARSGALAIEVRPLPETPTETVAVKLVPLPTTRDDFRLQHKTSDRAFLDKARHEAGTFEVIFVDEDGYLTEGSFTNIFVERDGVLHTPLIGALMPGVLRARLLDEGKAIETALKPDDLTNGFFIGNALRGLMPARLI
ncbi:aminodeoxychorismate synthase component I [Sphingomonas montanisoli]|uniref:Probable branched-chain-amino-acid aminotransferase n=1 Tax=Sphingomonas montanisoli TaxID=2606412 RepID=A0A5D9CF69_9SPHN|nr:aminodeoxychorismate synthase component I [Sphingomonas montanisoli]